MKYLFTSIIILAHLSVMAYYKPVSFNNGKNIQSQKRYAVKINQNALSQASSIIKGDPTAMLQQDICIDDLCYLFVDENKLNKMKEQGIVENYHEEVVYHPLLNISQSWSYDNIKFPSYEKGRTQLSNPPITTLATGYIAAIVDTGFTKHSNIFGANNTFGYLYDFGSGVNCINITGAPSDGCVDYFGHGTHVAGIVQSHQSGTAYGTGYGKILIAPYVTANSFGMFYDSDLYDALKDIYDRKMNGEKFVAVNFSIGGSNPSPTQYDVIRKLGEADIVFVAAAGNEANHTISYPAAYDLKNIVSVLALDPDKRPASYTNYGSGVTIGAPGTDIISTSIALGSVGTTAYDAMNDSNLQLVKWTKGAGFSATVSATDNDNIIKGVITIPPAVLTSHARSLDVTYDGASGQDGYLLVTCKYFDSSNNQIIAGKDIDTFEGGELHLTNNVIPTTVPKDAVKAEYDVYIFTKSSSPVTVNNVQIKLKYASDSERATSKMYMSGTSMAAPFVTGAIVTAKSIYEGASAGQLMRLLYATAVENPNLAGKVELKREIDVEAFFEATAYCGVMGAACGYATTYPEKILSGNDKEEAKNDPVFNTVKNMTPESGTFGCAIGGGTAWDIALIAGFFILIINRLRRKA